MEYMQYEAFNKCRGNNRITNKIILATNFVFDWLLKS